MPAEQLIDFMARNFSKFNSLILMQTTRQENQEIGGIIKTFEEKIWMKSPSLVHSKVLYKNVERVAEPATHYRRLLMANSGESLMQLLSNMGINLQSVAFTRLDGVIAYRIGDKAPEGPKLLIEKERFLPLLLRYRLSEYSLGRTITVRFLDYRELVGGWYPFEITCSYGDHIIETYIIHNLQANVPFDPALFDEPGTKPRQEEATEKGLPAPEEERLQQIIKTFEEKYR